MAPEIAGADWFLLADHSGSLAALPEVARDPSGTRVWAAYLRGPAPEGVEGLAGLRRLDRGIGLASLSARLPAARPAALARAVALDPWVARRLESATVLVALDRAAEAALAQAATSPRRATLVPAAQVASLWEGISALHALLGGLPDLPEETLARARALLPHLPAGAVPSAPVADVLRTTASTTSLRSAELVRTVAGLLPSPLADAGRSGLAAQVLTAEVWLAETEASAPSQEAMAAACREALAGADEAMEAGHTEQALGRLADAMALLFHRERHAEVASSPLVSDPGAFLEALHASTAYRRIARPDRPAVNPSAARRSGQRPRVLVLAGAYGSFHGPVVEALQEAAETEVLDLAARGRFLRRRYVGTDLLRAVGGLPAVLPDHGRGTATLTDLTAEERGVAQDLAGVIQRCDVVFADWADRSTVWASHLCPPGVRMVVRIHSLDALDPSFHLVDWRAVDEVVTVSEPLRRLVLALLDAVGARVPVTVLPNLAALAAMDRPKLDGARTTLGLVGWGRRVKDPLWALDLLARERSWRLVLIGPDLEAGRSGRARRYAARVRERMSEPDLRDRIELVGHTDDVAGALRRVGVILSTSLRESWHLGLVEGAASGAVPVVRDWPAFAGLGGPREIFPAEWVVEDLAAAEARVREVTDPAVWDEARARAREQANALFDPEQAARDYRRLVLGTGQD